MRSDGDYLLRRKAALLPVLRPRERGILQTGMVPQAQPDLPPAAFERLPELLFNWTVRFITR